MTADGLTAAEAAQQVPCCDYRDHSGDIPACACPEHPHSALHPFGGWPQPTADDLAPEASR